jgi:hypothetical protein
MFSFAIFFTIFFLSFFFFQFRVVAFLLCSAYMVLLLFFLYICIKMKIQTLLLLLLQYFLLLFANCGNYAVVGYCEDDNGDNDDSFYFAATKNVYFKNIKSRFFFYCCTMCVGEFL